MDINQVLNFEPHGLIDSPYLETYYRSVGNYPREVQTLKLMENVFNKALFRDSDDVTVNSHGTLSYDYIRINCHFVVNYFKNGNDTAAEEILCFTHGITGTGQNSAVRDFETQVIRHCRHYLENKCLGTREFVYLCTAFGTRLKIWKLFRGDHESTGMWGGYGLTVDDSSYLDVGDEEGSRQIKQAFDKIISRSSNPGNEQVTDVYPETISRVVDAWLAKNEKGDTCRFFFCQGNGIGTKPSDWKKADSKLFSKKRLIYKKDNHNVWT